MNCKHINITYQEKWTKDNPVPEITNAVCVDCHKPMPGATKALQERWDTNQIPIL